MEYSKELEQLNAIKSIDYTLKRIEQSLTAEKQGGYIYNAITKALMGERERNCSCRESSITNLQKGGEDIENKETKKSKAEQLENALLEYIEKHTKDTQPEIAVTIPTAAMALVELWKAI